MAAMTTTTNGTLGHRTIGLTGEFPGIAPVGKYVIRCEDHGAIGFAPTQRDAKNTPTTAFCTDCQGAALWRGEVEDAAAAYHQAKSVLDAAKARLKDSVLDAKARTGVGDRQLAKAAGVGEMTIREWRGVRVRRGQKVVKS